MFYVYIHGLNSGPESRSGNELERLLGQPVHRVANHYDEPFEVCLEKLEKQILAAAPPESPLCLMGTSLGGFYALQLRMSLIAKVAVWNPVIFPALQLARFTGENTRFTDGQKWHFSREALLSYAAAADPRPWQNVAWRQRYGQSGPDAPRRQIFLGNHDELLDHEVSQVFWQGFAPVEIMDSGHRIADFSRAKAFLACR